ncbi:MAG: thioredoxin domain-containing protein [Candidatus Pacearchaeota archaeon]|nr:thioredoxin domain-containing protein [Candidatus Pacearchaeota archaeon]
MAKKNKSWKVIIGVVLVLIVLALVAYFLSKNMTGKSVQNLDTLTLCLADKAVMYGANWCPHCQNQKSLFGDSWSSINYVECTEQQAKCQEAGVTGYPTWVILGKNYSGEKTASELAQLAGCEI